eukprot:9420827-Pyramimonas_sp.AAC.1
MLRLRYCRWDGRARGPGFRFGLCWGVALRPASAVPACLRVVFGRKARKKSAVVSRPCSCGQQLQQLS